MHQVWSVYWKSEFFYHELYVPQLTFAMNLFTRVTQRSVVGDGRVLVLVRGHPTRERNTAVVYHIPHACVANVFKAAMLNTREGRSGR